MSDAYAPGAWYWVPANKTPQVFSSALPGYVAEDDAAYQAWRAAGNLPSPILCDGELADVLRKAGLPNAIIAAAGASDFGGLLPEDCQAVVAAIGAAVASAANSTLDAIYETAGPSWTALTNEAQYVSMFNGFSGGLASLDFPARSGTVTFADPKDLLSVVKGLSDYLATWQRYWAAGAGGALPPLGTVTIP